MNNMKKETEIKIDFQEIADLKPVENFDIKQFKGLLQTFTTAPTHTPKNISEQICIAYISTEYRLYWYDTLQKAWKYAVGS